MKIRKCFVANSSSSSFVCEVCGNTATGFDACASDFEMVYCVNGHLICDEHRLNGEGGDDCDKNCDECDNAHCGESAIPESGCPICQFQTYSQPELKSYLIETRGIDPAVVFAEIKKVNKRRKKLYTEEYITYVLKENNLTDELILDELKEKFTTYKEFRNRNRKPNEA